MHGKKTLIIFIHFSFLIVACAACHREVKYSEGVKVFQDNDENAVRVIENENEKKVDVHIGGNFFTSYIYPEVVKKPVLYPVVSAKGNFITRGFPLHPREGERVDHPHHVGIWFNYGDVNGLDFWNNSDAIPAGKRENYGTIIHKKVNKVSSGKDKGELNVSLEWIGPTGDPIMSENATFVFSGSDGKRMVDRISTLTALDREVSMPDHKEGLFGIRVARELEHIADKPEILINHEGNISSEEVINNEGVSGWYASSEGIEGPEAWGTRAKWMSLSGVINEERILIAIFDHPENIGYPTYWHARGYGLFAANPLGQKVMSKGKEELDFKLTPGESVTFKYRIIFFSMEDFSADKIDTEFEKFIHQIY